MVFLNQLISGGTGLGVGGDDVVLFFPEFDVNFCFFGVFQFDDG